MKPTSALLQNLKSLHMSPTLDELSDADLETIAAGKTGGGGRSGGGGSLGFMRQLYDLSARSQRNYDRYTRNLGIYPAGSSAFQRLRDRGL